MIEQLIAQCEKLKYDYKALFDNKATIKSLNDNVNAHINVIIGVKGRHDNLKKCLLYLREAIKNVDVKISITIVENDDKPNHYNTFKDQDINYIFLPLSITNTNGLFSRALSFNVGYKFINKSKYYLFHDCDVLVEPNFFKILLDNYIKPDFKWLQPYCGKRLVMLNQNITELLICTDLLIDLPKITDYKLGGIGSPGFTILVEKNTFESVGGFDPELFYGFAPEDSYFFTKLVCLDTRVDTIYNCHTCCKPIHYANTPAIELYHLYHENQRSINPYFNFMVDLHDTFSKLKYIDKLIYLAYKKEKFIN